MSFAILRNAIRSSSNLGGAPMPYTKSDSVGFFVDQYYPRGFIVLTGGTLTVWVEDQDTPGYSKKQDLGEVPDGFTWTWGGVLGICETDSSGSNTTCSNIIAIP